MVAAALFNLLAELMVYAYYVILLFFYQIYWHSSDLRLRTISLSTSTASTSVSLTTTGWPVTFTQTLRTPMLSETPHRQTRGRTTARRLQCWQYDLNPELIY